MVSQTARPLRVGKFSILVSRRQLTVSILLILVVLVGGVFAMTIGTLPIGLRDVVAVLFGVSDNAQHTQIVLNLRLPRLITAVFAGGALGAAGAVFQSVSRNALGSPDVIGFTTGAATGAITQIVLFQGEPLQVSLGAVVGGMGTAAVVYLLSIKGGVTGGYRLILIGIGVGAVLNAVNGLLLVLGDLDNAVSANLWLSGSLDARNWGHALPVLIGALIILPLLSLFSPPSTLMEMGEDISRQLGIRTERTRLFLMLFAVALTGLATGATGPIAFVALASPQLVLRLAPSRGLPVFSSAFMGSCLLVVADVLTQSLPITASVPIGRMTGILGGIYLIWLLTRTKQV
jgi:ABC-type enterobactin transport system permease subunit